MIVDLAWLIAGACFGFAASVPMAERIRRRQVRAIVAAYEARIAAMKGRSPLRTPPPG